MKLVVYTISILAIVSSLFFSCKSDDDRFSGDSNLRLTYLQDTIRFDTVFTSIGTSTRKFKVYNRNKNGIRISNISLMNPHSGFRMNIDGQSGSSADNVPVLGKDSLYVFLELTVDPLKQNAPMQISDSIRFSYNGVTDYVRLEAVGQDVVLWHGKHITKDTLLMADRPFLIYDSLYVKRGATLTLGRGVSLYFAQGSRLSVDGKIEANGTVQDPVVLRASRTDNLFDSPKLPYDRVPGQWDGVRIGADSYGNVFRNVRIRNGVYGINFESSAPSELKATLENTVIQNTSKEGLLAVNCRLDVKNSLFSNSGINAVRLLGGSYDFLHCTIVNYMDTYWGMIRREAMEFSNSGIDARGKPLKVPLVHCSFINTIVAGSGNKELRAVEDKAYGFEYSFLNCLLKYPEITDGNMINIVWGSDPQFRYVYHTGDGELYPDWLFYYDFRLTEGSPARNRASREYAAELPEDMNGVSRRADEAPDIGCFEWTKN